MKELISIINPVRILKVGDFMQMAKITVSSDYEYYECVRLMKSYESLTSQPLKHWSYDNYKVSDLIYHISKYNEASKEKININFTDSFISQLIQ